MNMNSIASIPVAELSPASVPVSTASLWIGRAMSTFVTLFLLMDGVMKLMKPAFVVETTVRLGFPESTIVGLGVVLLVSAVLYAIPQTAILGAILLTGYFGGAIATHVRMSDPLFSHTLFPVYLGLLAWCGIFLRDARLRALIPLRS